jgi:spoIIIJ-associated protein
MAGAQRATAAPGPENDPRSSAVAEGVEGQPAAAGPGIGDGDHGSAPEGTTGLSDSAASTAEAIPSASASSEPSGTTRHRRADRDEPIEPEMVEADTERAGDFLEGLLDALDVDGDITTWVDESGGHVDLEGSDLDVLVGSNGETLDALQELTRIAVLRQSKRRVRLLLDINGYRAQHREQLIAVVRATAERVIASREDHEFEPMTPAERKIVHDAVAAIDGVRTESLGEEPYRRVVIRAT